MASEPCKGCSADRFTRVTTETFAFLRLTGGRFEAGDGSMPVDTLPELVAFRDVIVAVAEETWRAHNPGKKRLPNHYGDQLKLRVEGFKEGSSRPVMTRPREAIVAPPDDFDRARDLVTETIESLHGEGKLLAEFPAACVPKLSRLGRTLEPAEIFVLGHPSNAEKRASLDYGTRQVLRALQGGSSAKVRTLSLMGDLVDWDLDKRGFGLRLNSGTVIRGRYAPEAGPTIGRLVNDGTPPRVMVEGEVRVRDEITFEKFVGDAQIADLQAGLEFFDDKMSAYSSQLADEVTEILNSLRMELIAHFPGLGIALEQDEGTLFVEWSCGTWMCSAEFDCTGGLTLHRYDSTTGDEALVCAESGAPERRALVSAWLRGEW